MRNMAKIFGILVVMLLVGGITACDNGEENPEWSQSEEGSETVNNSSGGQDDGKDDQNKEDCGRPNTRKCADKKFNIVDTCKDDTCYVATCNRNGKWRYIDCDKSTPYCDKGSCVECFEPAQRCNGIYDAEECVNNKWIHKKDCYLYKNHLGWRCHCSERGEKADCYYGNEHCD